MQRGELFLIMAEMSFRTYGLHQGSGPRDILKTSSSVDDDNSKLELGFGHRQIPHLRPPHEIRIE